MSLLALAMFLLCGRAASASVLTANVSVDDNIWVYVSTSDTVQGTLIASGPWDKLTTGTYALTSGTTYYIHVAAQNTGGPGGFVGDFSVDTGFSFANGSAAMSTDPTHWLVSQSGFGSNYYTPTQWGTNGSHAVWNNPAWGTVSGISSTAPILWDSNSQLVTTLYFSTTLTSSGSAQLGVLPEPVGALALPVVGLMIGVLVTEDRRRQLTLRESHLT